MIQSITTHHCPKCNSINIVKNGTDYKGKQKFHCHDCDGYGTLEPQSRSYPEFVKDLLLRTYPQREKLSVSLEANPSRLQKVPLIQRLLGRLPESLFPQYAPFRRQRER